jgi:ADP-ribose pyrophosphatase YjhB (NUDIX family)
MKRLSQLIGVIVFWLSWPLSWVYLRGSTRTRLIIYTDSHVLLLKNRFNPRTHRWNLPGGGLYKGEDAAAGAVRELTQETGLSLEAKDFLELYKDTSRQYGLSFKYICLTAKVSKTEPLHRQLAEVSEAAWIPIKNLSQTPLAPDANDAVQAWLKDRNLVK